MSAVKRFEYQGHYIEVFLSNPLNASSDDEIKWFAWVEFPEGCCMSTDEYDSIDEARQAAEEWIYGQNVMNECLGSSRVSPFIINKLQENT